MTDLPETMVERVARAIDPGAFDDAGNLARDVNMDRMRLRRNKARKAARAAIGALREPTKAMIEASGASEDHDFHINDFRGGWQAAIDTALGQPS